MARQKFNQTVTVKGKPEAFEDICRGDCFTLPGDIGFGQIWLGFHVYCKIDENTAADLTNGSIKSNILPTDQVLGVTFGLIEKPPSPDAATFKLTDRQQIDLFLYAMRYAFGRKTVAVSDVADHIVAHWSNLNDRAQMFILRDLKQAIAEDDRQPDRLGDLCDRAVWDELLKKLEKVAIDEQ